MTIYHMKQAAATAEAIAKKALQIARLQEQIDALRALRGHGYSIMINGTEVRVADTVLGDDRQYAMKIVRGREMIHLGAIKALDGILDDHHQQMRKLQEHLARETGSIR